MRQLPVIFCVLICFVTVNHGFASSQAAEELRLLYHAYREDGAPYGGDLYVYDLAQKTTTRLTPVDERVAESEAVFSPTGKHLAFIYHSGTFRALGVSQLNEDNLFDRTNFVPILWNNGIVNIESPAWSPIINDDTAELAFVTNQNPQTDFSTWNTYDLWVVQVPMRRWWRSEITPGTAVVPKLGISIHATMQPLTQDDYHEFTPEWSADGQQIVFASERDGSKNLYIMNISDASSMKQVTDSSAEDIDPTWSPDGQRIAFASDQDGDFEVYIVQLENGDVRQITFNSISDTQPVWSPDGQYIAYVSDGMISLIHPDGTAAEALFSGTYPSWVR